MKVVPGYYSFKGRPPPREGLGWVGNGVMIRKIMDSGDCLFIVLEIIMVSNVYQKRCVYGSYTVIFRFFSLLYLRGF